VLKWLSEFYVRRVYLENVPEFLSWGPLGSNGKPLKSKRGATFNAFVEALRSLGYTVDWQILTAADYGDPTTRRRFFLQAVRGREKIRWPEPTHARTPGLFGERPWVPAREIIDWSIRGESVFSRKRPLAPATIRRIETGIRRYWGEWAEPFLLMLTHGGRTMPVGAPMPTVTGAHRGEIGIVEPFMVPFYGERPGQDPRSHGTGDPVPTIPASGHGKFGLIEPFILHQDAPGAPRRISDPVPTIRARNGHGLVEPFLIHYYGNGGAEPVRVPIGTVTTHDRFGLVNGTAGLDITFRMLQPHELAAAQGFPDDYWFAGTKTDQVKQIGNAVPVNIARALATAGLGAA
jgi:DNA (cytosine-5)-methyltransferase 1